MRTTLALLKKSKKRFFIYLLGIVMVAVIAGFGFQEVSLKLNQLNKRMLKETAKENGLVVKKEFNLLYQHVLMLNQLLVVDERLTMDKIITPDTGFNNMLAAYVFRDRHNNVFKKGFSVDEDRISTVNTNFKEEAQFHKIDGRFFVIRHFPLGSGEVYWFIDLHKLNEYFWNAAMGGRAYFSVYSPDGICLMHPSFDYVGLQNKAELDKLTAVSDTIAISPYLELDVMVNSLDVNDYLGPTKILISIPVFLNANDFGEVLQIIIVFGILFIGISVLFINLLYRDRERLRKVELDNVQYERERALMQFEKLREQMNPHFLFNSLGSLQQLIRKENVPARTFVNKLVRVYRKILHTDDKGLSMVSIELELAQEYYYLQNVRFGDVLKPLSIAMDTEALQKKIPRLSIQILIENAIKHNEVSAEYPLQVFIQQEGGALRIHNTIRKRQFNKEDLNGGYGIAFLQAVYQYYNVEGFRIDNDGVNFTVYLPLL